MNRPLGVVLIVGLGTACEKAPRPPGPPPPVPPGAIRFGDCAAPTTAFVSGPRPLAYADAPETLPADAHDMASGDRVDILGLMDLLDSDVPVVGGPNGAPIGAGFGTIGHGSPPASPTGSSCHRQ